jgi:tetratricopeptide (TPR) repeat protein
MSSRPWLKPLAVFTGVAVGLTATLSIRAVADEQSHPPILIPNVPEPDEMRIAPLPMRHMVLTPADRMLEEAIKANKSDAHAMLPAINRIIASYPEYSPAYVMRLRALCEGSDKDAILSDISNGLKFSASPATFPETLKRPTGSLYGMRAKIEYLEGDYSGAISDLEKAVHADLTAPTAFVNTGGIEPEQTASLCTWTEPAVDALVRQFPEDYRSHLFRGLFFAFFASFDVKWLKPALDELNKAGELDPKSALPSFFAAQMLRDPTVFLQQADELGWDEAREKVDPKVLGYYDQALSVDPNLIPALKGRAAIHLDLKQHWKAIDDYDKIISADPEDWIAYHDRGLVKMSFAPYEAISDFTAAIKIEGRELLKSSDYEARADAYMQTRQWDLAIEDLTTAISLQVGSIAMLGNVRQFRDIYPEYAAASDEAIGRKLNQTFYPDVKYEDLSQQFLSGRPLASTTIPELYLKRSDAYLHQKAWSHALTDFRRAANGFPDYAPTMDRWREFSQAYDANSYIDMQTFDDARSGSVKLWIKQANGERDAPRPYRLFRFELNCGAEQIRTLSWAEYDASGTLKKSGEGGRWGSIYPNTLGEVLEQGTCGTARSG